MILSAYLTAIRYMLDDSGSAVWSDAELTAAVRRALREYNVVNPRRLDTVFTFTAADREADLSSITGLINVERVWYPYDSDDTDPGLPTWARFEMRLDQKLHLFVDDEPAVDDEMRVYYTALHTIKDLDSATSTTLPDEDEYLIVAGAAGYAAKEQAVATIGVVNVSGYTPVHWRVLAQKLLADFEGGLYAVRTRAGLRETGPAAMA